MGKTLEGAELLERSSLLPNPPPSRTFPPRSVQHKSRFCSLFWTECGGKFFFGWVGFLKKDRFVSCTLRCGETSSFVPQIAKFHTPIPFYRGKSNFFGREFRVAGTCGAAKPRPSYRETPNFMPRFHSAVENLLCGAGRVAVPNGSRELFCRP